MLQKSQDAATLQAQLDARQSEVARWVCTVGPPVIEPLTLLAFLQLVSLCRRGWRVLGSHCPVYPRWATAAAVDVVDMLLLILVSL